MATVIFLGAEQRRFGMHDQNGPYFWNFCYFFQVVYAQGALGLSKGEYSLSPEEIISKK